MTTTTAPITFRPLPRGWFENRDESVACPHRDMFVCPSCLASEPQAFELSGRTYWTYDADEFAELTALLVELETNREADRRGNLRLIGGCTKK